MESALFSSSFNYHPLGPGLPTLWLKDTREARAVRLVGVGRATAPQHVCSHRDNGVGLKLPQSLDKKA